MISTSFLCVFFVVDVWFGVLDVRFGLGCVGGFGFVVLVDSVVLYSIRRFECSMSKQGLISLKLLCPSPGTVGRFWIGTYH